MTQKQLFIKHMESEFPITLKVIKAFPPDQPEFKPHERSNSAKQLVQTMIGEISGIMKMLHGDEQVFDRVEVSSMEEAAKMYEQEYAKSLEFVKNVPDEDLEKPLEGMMAKFFGSRMDGAWMFLKDSIHHRGQLSVYVRMAGGKVPAIYGPSADENPFQ